MRNTEINWMRSQYNLLPYLKKQNKGNYDNEFLISFLAHHRCWSHSVKAKYNIHTSYIVQDQVE